MTRNNVSVLGGCMVSLLSPLELQEPSRQRQGAQWEAAEHSNPRLCGVFLMSTQTEDVLGRDRNPIDNEG